MSIISGEISAYGVIIAITLRLRPTLPSIVARHYWLVGVTPAEGHQFNTSPIVVTLVENSYAGWLMPEYAIGCHQTHWHYYVIAAASWLNTPPLDSTGSRHY